RATGNALLHGSELFNFVPAFRFIDYYGLSLRFRLLCCSNRGELLETVERGSRSVRALSALVAHALECFQNCFERLRKLHLPHIGKFSSIRQIILTFEVAAIHLNRSEPDWHCCGSVN